MGAVKIEHGFDNIQGTEEFLQVFKELYRVCADGALIEIEVGSSAAVKDLNLPFKGWSVSQEQLRFFNRSFREQVMQQFWGYNPLAAFDVNFNALETQAHLVKPASELMQEHNLTSAEQLQDWIKQHPESVSSVTYTLQAVRDESKHFAFARINGFEPFPMQIYPWDGQHDMWVSQMLSKYHIWEAVETNIFIALLEVLFQRKDSEDAQLRFANIGANIGWYTVVGALLDERIHVDAFEPTPETVGMLRHNVALNDLDSQVTVYDCAVSDTVGESQLYVNSNDAGSNSLMDNDGQHYQVIGTTIKVETLDHLYLSQDKQLWPELLVIDVEGHEQRLFEGAKGMFEQGYRPVLITEFSPILLKLRGKCTYYRDLITKYHYQPYVINSQSRQPTEALLNCNLEALDANYDRLSDPKQNPQSKYMEVVFLPQGFDAKAIITKLNA